MKTGQIHEESLFLKIRSARRRLDVTAALEVGLLATTSLQHIANSFVRNEETGARNVAGTGVIVRLDETGAKENFETSSIIPH